MPDIDIDKIKPGDTVRVRFQNIPMERQKVPPIEFTTTTYSTPSGAGVMAGHVFLDENAGVTILEHIPARPDWADALVVRDKDGDLWGRNKQDYFRAISRDSTGLSFSARVLNDLAPITVVLDADGNPPEPERSEDANCARAAYRKAYAPNPDHMAAAHKAFHAGWDAHNPPPEPEPEWLDADALDKLPEWTVILPDGGGQPRYRDHLGHWRLIASAGGTLSESVAPARVLWAAPEVDR